MKALILNSGTGSRMGNLTIDKPKCLIQLNHETILERQIRILKECGITDFIITLGPHEEKIKNLIKEKFLTIKVEYVPNEKYSESGPSYSLWLTKNLINDDIIYLHGDMIFTKELMQTLLTQKENSVLIKTGEELWEKDAKAKIQEGLVKEISTEIFGQNCYNLNQIYKLSKNFFLDWLTIIESFISNNNLNIKANETMSSLLEKEKLLPVFHTEQVCMEIDTPEDLAKVKQLLQSN